MKNQVIKKEKPKYIYGLSKFAKRYGSRVYGDYDLGHASTLSECKRILLVKGKIGDIGYIKKYEKGRYIICFRQKITKSF